MKKSRRDFDCSFVGIDRRALRSESWRNLSLRARIFYIHLKGNFNGENNGDIGLCFSELSGHPGLSSRKAFYGAAKELEKSGWIRRKKGGGLYRHPNRYEITGAFDSFGLRTRKRGKGW